MAKTRKVLIVAYQYPIDRTGTGVRMAKLAKYLPDWGWTPVIVSSKPSRVEDPRAGTVAANGSAIAIYRSPRNELDVAFVKLKSALKKLRPSRAKAQAVQSPTITQAANSAERRKSLADLVYPDSHAFWMYQAAWLGVRAARTEQVDLILGSYPFISELWVPHRIHIKTSIPWVMDFRDPWIREDNRWHRRFNPEFERRDLALEQAMIQSCSGVVGAVPSVIESLLRRYPALNPQNAKVILNGFDPSDFEGLTPVKRDKLTIAHVGKFYHPRLPDPFLQALAKVLERRPDWRAKWTVRFVGELPGSSIAEAPIQGLGLSDIVELAGRVSPREALQETISADLLLLVPGPGTDTMTGKLYEYIAAQKPIFALSDRGSAVETLIRTNGLGAAEASDDIEAATASLEAMMQAQINGQSFCQADPHFRDRFDRRLGAKAFAELFDQIYAPSSFAR